MPAIAQIIGIGTAGLTRKPSPTAALLACAAIDAAIADAGLCADEVDGLLFSRSGGATEADLNLSLQGLSGLRNLSLLQMIDCEGTSALQMIATASAAVAQGAARHVVCVFADAPLRAAASGQEAFGKAKSVSGIAGLRYAAGAFGGASNYALSAQRHMHEHGISERQLGAIAVSTRKWATLNPLAALRSPLDIEAYLQARFIVEPLRLFDCAIPVNGAVAVIVSAAGRAADPARPPVYIHGIGQGHQGAPGYRNAWERGSVSRARDLAFAMARVTPRDVDICQFYDAFTIMTLLALEDYGFCGRGEGGAFAGSGALAPGGTLPTNTGGGHLSGYYMQGMTPVSEAIWQARGDAGARQCARRDVILVTNDGGWFDHHACMIVSPHASLN